MQEMARPAMSVESKSYVQFTTAANKEMLHVGGAKGDQPCTEHRLMSLTLKAFGQALVYKSDRLFYAWK